MNKPLLGICILLSGILLGFLHHRLKPEPTEQELRNYSTAMTTTTQWQGRFPPDFELTTTRGEHFQLSENIGKKVIILNFFATWCGPCRDEMPELNRYFNQHKNEPFILLGIDAEESSDRVKDFLSDLKIDFPAGIDAGTIQKLYGVSAFPTSVLIGVDGKVQFYEADALPNADVVFDGFLQRNRDLIKAGDTISLEQYRQQLQKQPPLGSAPGTANSEPKDELNDRAKRIVGRMDCPCGCDKKVHACTCKTSTNVKHALASEDFKDKSDADIMTSLNKRFCMGGM